ncbi:hypothetical protein BGZ63DRAFT_421502 [Mariannaea sp. PMI_226]|nr:hypothetical protein BGZ63DRAFT_421502 [Mariannaea sp. PMI_226]
MASLDNKNTYFQLTRLPIELLGEVFTFLEHSDKQSLLQLRLVNTELEHLARRHAFRTVRLSICSRTFVEMNFLHIGMSRRLSQCVRIVYINTWGPYLYCKSDSFQPPVMFMSVLPYMRYFQGMTDLHLQLAHNQYPKLDEQVKRDYSFWTLDVVLNCLAGKWCIERQKRLDRTLKFSSGKPLYGKGLASKAAPIRPRVFTAALLEHPIDSRIMDSPAFLDLLNHHGVGDLKLSIIEDYYQNAIKSQSLHIDLHKSWLSKNLGRCLRHLSLYWRGPAEDTFPPLNMAKSWPGEAAGEWFPVLKVLSIGRYAFTKPDQVAWIANVGKGFGYGGLEELYLDDCRILWQDLPKFLQDYILDITDFIGPHLYDRNRQPMRWYKILAYWASRMPNLKRFKIGTGDWNYVHRITSANLAPWIALLAHIFKDESGEMADKSFDDFNLPRPGLELFRDMRKYGYSQPSWESTRYCSQRQLAVGEGRSAANSNEHFKNPYVDLPQPLPWDTEPFLKLFDEAAVSFMYRLVRERNKPETPQRIHEMLFPQRNL